MMAQAFPPGMAPGHPGMGAPAHPMAGMQHPGAHMGGPPAQGMMQGMHPGVSGPQVTQGGPMVSGMPQGPGTPAPGPMHNGSMAMAHLGPQQQMFQQQNPQMNFGQMPMAHQQAFMRQQMMAQLQQQQRQGVPMGMPGNPNFSQAQMAQMKMNMPIQQQMQLQQQNAQHMAQQQHQQRMIHQQAQQQAALAAQNQQRAQQMQLSRSQEQQTTQPPQPHPTPAPQNQPQPQNQPTPQNKPPTSQPQQQQQPPQPPTTQPSQPNQPVKQSENEEVPQIKPDQANAIMMQDIPKEQMNGHCVLKLILFQDSLANPDRPHELDYWDDTIRKYFSPIGLLRQQLFNTKNTSDKAFLLHFPSLARFYHAHFVSGIRQILLQSYNHVQNKQMNGETAVFSTHASLTYVFNNDIRVTTSGSMHVLFDDSSRIVRLDIATNSWQEYIPKSIIPDPTSPDMKQSPKMNKNVKKLQQQNKNQPPKCDIPSAGVNDWGVTHHVLQFLEIAEVLSNMTPLIEYYHNHPGLGPRESLLRINQEHQQNFANANNARMQNQIARQANGQIGFPGANMGPAPHQFNSPSMAHLGLPQAQGSPHIGGSTGSPAQNSQGGVAMMHQMSAQGSNLSGSQGASTNTSPNVTNKRRRASQVKMEGEGGEGEQPSVSQGKNVKPSPRIGGKRQKGAA